MTPGSVFALVGWLGASLLLRLYVEYLGNYEATYGSIGGVMLLMLWLYLSGVTLLVGAEIDAEIEFAKSSEGKSSEGASTAPSDASPRT
jgi:membrane protein